MVSPAVRAALERLWTDRCTVIVREEVTDPVTHITDFAEKVLCEGQPCKLSFETLKAAGGDPVTSAMQLIKLILAPEVEIPAGSRITVTRSEPAERTVDYGRASAPAMFHNHQEICLELFRGWA